MSDTFGQQHGSGTLASQSSSPGTEFDRTLGQTTQQEADPSEDVKRKAKEDYDAVRKMAESGARKAMEKASDMADQQKTFAADQINQIASALEKVGSELQSGSNGGVGRYVGDLGSSARNFAERVKDKDMSQIAGMVEDFGRRQPLAFLGIAAIAGLAASRFLIASSDSNTSYGDDYRAQEDLQSQEDVEGQPDFNDPYRQTRQAYTGYTDAGAKSEVTSNG